MLLSSLIAQLAAGHYHITEAEKADSIPEAQKYAGATFSLNRQKCVYREAKVTQDRPGAFLAIWKREEAATHSKPIPLAAEDLDYLFIKVTDVEGKQTGFFVFPVSLLLDRGIIHSAYKKGKTGFRVFPPWTTDRGNVGTQVFSASGKKTQSWQLPYFIAVHQQSAIDLATFATLFGKPSMYA